MEIQPIEVWTDRFADDLRNNIGVELKQKGLKDQEIEEAIRHIMIFIRQWLPEHNEFDEKAFRREWAIRGVGMGMPTDAMHGARCYHHWFVKSAKK